MKGRRQAHDNERVSSALWQHLVRCGASWCARWQVTTGDVGDGCAEDARIEEVAAESVDQRSQKQRVSHRPGKRRRGGRRYYTWAERWGGSANLAAWRCRGCWTQTMPAKPRHGRATACAPTPALRSWLRPTPSRGSRSTCCGRRADLMQLHVDRTGPRLARSATNRGGGLLRFLAAVL